jgi:hypothetical protein
MNAYSQIPVTNVVNYSDLANANITSGTYIKDVNGDFNSFIGNWVWIDGDQKVTIVIKKINQYFNTDKLYYRDFLVADYIYTTNYDATTIVNTTLTTQNSLNPRIYPMISFGPEDFLNAIEFTYRDVIINKHITSISTATFTKLSGSSNQMLLELKNPNCPQMVLPGQPLPNLNFTLPNNIVLTKQ